MSTRQIDGIKDLQDQEWVELPVDPKPERQGDRCRWYEALPVGCDLARAVAKAGLQNAKTECLVVLGGFPPMIGVLARLEDVFMLFCKVNYDKDEAPNQKYWVNGLLFTLEEAQKFVTAMDLE